jgi:hypothetical protein
MEEEIDLKISFTKYRPKLKLLMQNFKTTSLSRFGKNALA